MQSQRIVITVPLEENLLTSLHDWGRSFDFSHVESITFLHIVKKNITPLEFGLMESPDEETYRDMKPTISRFLKEEAAKIIPREFHGKIEFEVTKGFNPEEEALNTLKRLNATLVVVATRGKHGLEGWLHSSFTDYMIKHAPCDVFVVRPHEEFRKSA